MTFNLGISTDIRGYFIFDRFSIPSVKCKKMSGWVIKHLVCLSFVKQMSLDETLAYLSSVFREKSSSPVIVAHLANLVLVTRD